VIQFSVVLQRKIELSLYESYCCVSTSISCGVEKEMNDICFL
jgi:hypothetical protein